MNSAKKFIVFSVISFFMVFNFAHAAIKLKSTFAGKIINEEAVAVTSAESSGFKCAGLGDTFDIKPIGRSPAGPYMIKPGVLPKGIGGAPAPKKWILGQYSNTPITITCTSTEGDEWTIDVYPVTLFATSRL